VDARELSPLGWGPWGAVPLVVLLACGGPLLAIPGGKLAGPVVTDSVVDWSFVADPVLDLETRPEAPYSVTLRARLIEGQLYLDPAEGRRWLDHLRANPEVRIRIAGRVYPAQAVLVGAPGELAGFDPTRFVYRLDPVPSSPTGVGGRR